MKSLIFAIVVMIMSSLTAFTQQPLGPSCEGKALVGVSIQTSGFGNPVEAERFTAEVMNTYLRDPSKPYCYVAAAGVTERRLVTRTSMKVLERDRTVDGIKPQLIRSGINIAVEEISRRLPSRVRTQVRRTARQYTYEPRVRVAQLQISTEVWMYAGKEVVWKGLQTRYFTLEEKYYGSYSPKSYRIIAGGSVQELANFEGVIDLPETANFTSDKRVEQLLKLLVTMGALKPENRLLSEQELLAVNAPQEVR